MKYELSAPGPTKCKASKLNTTDRPQSKSLPVWRVLLQVTAGINQSVYCSIYKLMTVQLGIAARGGRLQLL